MPKRVLTGKVVSDKMQKTRIAEVERFPTHPIYKKVQSRRKRYKFHDEQELSKAGDLVRIVECRPMSRDKHFRLLEVVDAGSQA
ncbi:30S ribosomal protein S17 [bacterium (Candidatus Blackallbacteria) CG17_big_fil_post_rev_8_21_14_2_50_48_46]|uniref:Small ribosomal subunit protein uS17 n=1 Tax=bacterium (Candidatus Blackallbacteria) CG17_big_fil_post_rev_8_21_14_2_50_48_46 TaxID=2014261 RepID=A0A2M7G147_9BACT|nr:MAG: 30S ribosomal protein S17 [bacterium (Candidatus Blackallbacteria) CG18_big_fil_WC_8_21_14_2_50_49_26]PIW15402.1 MAG: 30S ribosomal protein S17 [bacterium (Candidatus Blackallbacteria) CG17_big_fil_post_rev_8_21_14_2_50_48_46]PIW49737.1 MAG: 30S ribosomal protein S17 [bacterium (Candidatus Blackallbacteria) CG13_big_fil_rev_8_21_14_2_50_49_14]